MKSQRIDPSKLRLTKQSDSDSIQLGPSRGFSGWGKGSSGSGKNTPPQQEERPSTPTNRFSALQGGMSDRDMRDDRSSSGQRLPTGRSMGRGGPMGRGSRDRMSVTPRGSMEKERSSALATARQFSRSGSSKGPSRENSVEGRRNLRTPTPTRPASGSNSGANANSGKVSPAPVKQLTRDDWETKMKSIIDEYIHNKDMKEVLDSIKELGAQSNKDLITECSINYTLERSEVARKSTGMILAELVKQELLSLDLYMKGLSAVLEFIDDLAIDIPNVWDYIAEIISPIFTSSAIPLDKLESICAPLMSIGKASKLAAAILNDASHKVGHIELGKWWNANSLKWSSFMSPDENEEEFIRSNKLEYTVSTSTSQSSKLETQSKDVSASLDKLLVTDSAPNETVFDWIDTNLSDKQLQEQQFIRSLVISVSTSCIDGTSLKEDSFRKRIPLINKYLDSKSEREYFALLALEEVMETLEHPANLLSEFLYMLSEEELVADESFFHWEKNSKTGVAVKSVGKFFGWLKSSQQTD